MDPFTLRMIFAVAGVVAITAIIWWVLLRGD